MTESLRNDEDRVTIGEDEQALIETIASAMLNDIRQQRGFPATDVGALPSRDAAIYRSEAKAALWAVRKHEGWQPIKTAPKDAHDIDLWIEFPEPGWEGYRAANCCWLDGWEDDKGPVEVLGRVATFWRPLPLAPEAA